MINLETWMVQDRTYAYLVKNADALLESNIYRTERLLLRLVRALYTKRLRELVMVLPAEKVEELLRE